MSSIILHTDIDTDIDTDTGVRSWVWWSYASAAAKKKRAALRASQCKVSKDTGCRNETNLDDEVAKFNEEQHEFNERRRALLQRISERETQRCMQQISKAPPQVAQSRPSGANISAVRSSQSGANGTESHGQTTQADRSSQGGQSETESHGQMWVSGFKYMISWGLVSWDMDMFPLGNQKNSLLQSCFLALKMQSKR